MNSALIKKLKESLVSVFPIVALVFILNFTSLFNFSAPEMIVFLVSAAFLIFGIALFNLGADLAMTPMGEHIGSGLTKLKSLSLLLGVCFAMGILITVAEPDLTVLANGEMRIPDRPGLGIDLKEEELLKHPFTPIQLRHYRGDLTNIRPVNAERYDKMEK